MIVPPQDCALLSIPSNFSTDPCKVMHVSRSGLDEMWRIFA